MARQDCVRIKEGLVTLAVGEAEGRGVEKEKPRRPRENSGVCSPVGFFFLIKFIPGNQGF